MTHRTPSRGMNAAAYAEGKTMNGAKVKTTWPVHWIATCMTCGKEWQGRNAQAVGKKHAERYGHRVQGEISLAFEYDYTPEARR